MQNGIINGLEATDSSLRGCVLAVGNFDGVHVGHRRILAEATEIARAESRKVAAMTFEPPPDLVLRRDDVPRRITPADEKCRLLREAGADAVVKVTATEDLLKLSADEFIEQVVVERFAPACVVEGHNFRFGRGRSGDVETLRAAGRIRGFDVRVVEPVMVEISGSQRRVSSTLIRDLIASGRVEDAARCLGRNFVLFGDVIGGKRLGRVLEFPTVNVRTHEQVVPADGVYAGFAKVEGGDGPAAISIGDRPTFDGRERQIEANLLKGDGDHYGKNVSLIFIRRLRQQQKFPSAEQLKQQIAKDVQRVREICRESAGKF